MKVKPIRKNTDISDAMLDDFFKSDENYTGNAESDEEERSEHDKHWNECRQIMQYSLENDALKQENEKLKAEIMTLQNQNQILSVNADTAYQNGLNEMRELVKPEIIKEFAEIVKEKFRDLARIDHNGKPMFIVGDAFVDNLVKEMGGDDK